LGLLSLLLQSATYFAVGHLIRLPARVDSDQVNQAAGGKPPLSGAACCSARLVSLQHQLHPAETTDQQFFLGPGQSGPN